MQTISGFTFVRNGFAFGYPFVPSIQSLLPLVDELIIVVGDSEDGTREAIEAIKDSRIVIVDSVWDMSRRESGSIFAEQSNMGLSRIQGDWGVHLQVDEVLHESAPERLRSWIQKGNARPDVAGLTLPFLHFWGDFKHIRHTRRTHAAEVRLFKNDGSVRSYKDSQGFRQYPSETAYQEGHPGQKLRVLLANDCPIYHYSYARHPRLMRKKDDFFHRFWHDDAWLAARAAATPTEFDFNDVDRLDRFEGAHPAVMQEVIAAQDWQFTYDPKRSNMTLKDSVLNGIERITGKRFFTFRNYRIV
jgi:hypothetical protein